MALFGAAYGPDEVDQYLQGLFTKLVGSDDLEKIQACVKDTTAVSKDLQTAVD